MMTNEIVGSPEWTDPDDAPVLTEAEARDVEVFKGDTFVRRGRGRPKTGNAKELVSLRLDPEVLAQLRSAGPGWQTQVNLILRQVLGISQDTAVAVYDTTSHAEAAVNELLTANVQKTAISRHTAEGTYSAAATSVTTRRTDATSNHVRSSLVGGSSEDHTVYDNAVQSGGNVVSVTTVPEHDYESVMQVLEKHNPVTTGAMTVGTTTRSGSATTGVTAAQGGTIQLAEENLAVSKRLVNRGGTRVRRYVVEAPVQEAVSLHEEKVTPERHPATDGRPVTDADFTEKTIELTETAEEAVVSKTARVVEEVSLGKIATDCIETTRDTLRKEEVKIEQIRGKTTTLTTLGSYTPKV